MTQPLTRMMAALVLLAAFAVLFNRSSPDRPDGFDVARCDAEAPQPVDALEACLAVQPDNIEVMLDLGTTYEASGEWDRAERLYRRVIDVDPRDAEGHLRLGRALRQRGDAILAREQGERALAIRPNNAEALALARP